MVLRAYRAQFRGLKVGRNVLLGRGAIISVENNGRIVIGDGVFIGAHAAITASGLIEIGDNSFVGPGCIIAAAERVSVGADALIAAYCTIRDQNHGFADPGLPYRSQLSTIAPVSLGRNVWLGTHVTVVKGVAIGDDVIVGANSVVTRDIPPASLWAGVPAKPIRVIERDLKSV
jgi:acetyltransferase-like isoleucine patch superfamily enzyme